MVAPKAKFERQLQSSCRKTLSPTAWGNRMNERIYCCSVIEQWGARRGVDVRELLDMLGKTPVVDPDKPSATEEPGERYKRYPL